MSKVRRFWINTQQYVDSQGPYVDEETGEPTGRLIFGLMVCPDCQGTKEIDAAMELRNAKIDAVTGDE